MMSARPYTTIGTAMKIPIKASPVIMPAANSVPLRFIRSMSSAVRRAPFGVFARIVRSANQDNRPPRKIGAVTSRGR